MDGRTGKFQGLPESCSLAILVFPSSLFGTILQHGQHLHILSERWNCDEEDTTETEEVLRIMGTEFVLLSST